MSAAATAIVDLNLLPASQRPTEISGRAAAIAAGFVLAIAGIVPFAIQAHRAESRAAHMEQRAEQAQNQLRNLQLEFVQARALRIEIDETNAKTAALDAERHTLQQGTRPLHDELLMLNGWGFVPSGARITRVTGTPGGLRVEGISANPLDAIGYAEHLSTEGGFPSARLESFAPAAGGGAFVVEVTR